MITNDSKDREKSCRIIPVLRVVHLIVDILSLLGL